MSGTDISGHMGLSDANSRANVDAFRIRRALDRVRTMMPVEVVKVYGGGVGPAPTLDVRPLINQVDGHGNQVPHGTILSVPCARNQGGDSAIINDPQVGDLGMLVISDRDLSTVQKTSARSAPGSSRRHSPADGIYHGAAMNKGAPAQYLYFTRDGFLLVDRNGGKITSKGGSIYVEPAKGGMVYLGGSPDDGGSFSPVLTVAGPSSNVQAKAG